MRATLLISASLLLLPARLAYGDCTASVGGLTITDPPTATRASAAVNFSLTGTGNLSIYINGSHQYGAGVSGTGTRSDFLGPQLAGVQPGDYTYRAVVTADCGATAEESVTRSYDPRPTVFGSIGSFEDDMSALTVNVQYTFPYINENAGAGSRKIFVDGGGGAEDNLQPGEPWQGAKSLPITLHCVGTGENGFFYRARTSFHDSVPAEPSRYHLTAAKITGLSAEPGSTAGSFRVTVGYAFESTQFASERRIEVYFNGGNSAVFTSGSLADPSGSVSFEFSAGCLADGNYPLRAVAIACGSTSANFRDEETTTITVPVSHGNIDINQLFDPSNGTIKLSVAHALPPGITTATRTIRVLSFVGDNGIAIPGDVIRGPDTVTTGTPSPFEFSYTPPFWARTIEFQATLSWCNGHVSDVTTAECPNSCNAQPPIATPGPMSFSDGNMRYSDSDPLPPLLDTHQLARNYDSHHRVRGVFGRGWVSMFDSRLFVLTSSNGDTISLSDEQNESFIFLRRNGVYTQMWPKGRSAAGTLALESATSLYVHRKAGAATASLYRSSDGRFAGYRHLGTGHELRIEYDSNGYPLSVKDAWTDVTWNVTVNTTTKRITSIVIGNLTWQYAYVNDNLTAVTAPGSIAWRTYEYASDRLVAARDPLGNLIEGHAYDASGRAISETRPNDEITGVQYNAAGTTSTQLVTRVTMKSGATPEYTLQPIGGSWRTVKITNGCAPCGARDGVFAYDGDGHLIREQNASGYITVRTYANQHLGTMQEHLRPAGCDPATSQTHCMLDPVSLKTAALDPTPATIATTYEYADPSWPDKPTTILTPSVGTDGQRAEKLAYHSVTGETVRHSIAGSMTVTTLYGDQPPAGDDGGSTVPYAPAFEPGGNFQASWLQLPQPPLRKSIDGPRADIADVASFVYYPVDATVLPATLRGRLAAVKNAAGHITRYENYDVFGNVTRTVDPSGVVTEMTFDALGRLLTSTIKGVAGCDTASDPLCATDLTAARTYSENTGPLATEQRPGGGVTTYAYDDRGRVTVIARGPLGSDLRERIEYTYDPLTGKKSLEKFLAKQGASWIEKRRESYAYDSLAQLQTVTHADANSVGYTYDEEGRIAGVRDENHTTANTTYAYDPAGRLAVVRQTLDTGLITTQYAYDVHGHLAAVTDPNGNVTSYRYDDLGRMVRQISPVTAATRYEYDPAGNLLRSTDANEMTTERTYDALGRVVRATSRAASDDEPPPDPREEEPPPPPPASPLAETVQWTYDAPSSGNAFAIGRLTSMIDPAGVTTYSYERRGLLTQESRTLTACLVTRDAGAQCTSGRTDVTTYRYDADGNRSRIGYPSGVLTLNYSHDYAGRPTSAGGVITTADYLPFGPLTKLQSANGTTQTMQYDARYRMTNSSLSKDGVSGQPGIIAGYGYDYDAAGNVTHLRDVKDSEYQRHFAYDDLNRLIRADTKEDTPNNVSPLWGKGEYSWDAMGNILTAKLNEVTPSDDPELLAKGNPKKFRPPDHPRSATAIVQPLGRVMSFEYEGTTPVLAAVTLNDLSHSVMHDAAGNELAYVVTRTYSPRNLLQEVADLSDPGAELTHRLAYAYDGRGVRTVRAESPSNGYGTVARRSYVYTPELQLLSATRNDATNVWEPAADPQPELANNVHYEIVWFGPRPVAQFTPGAAPLYTFTDHLGTPLLQTDSTATIKWRVEYEPFGNIYDVREGTRTDQPLRFPGQELGMTWEGPEENYNIFRWYKGGWGRYTQSDPWGTGGLGIFVQAASTGGRFVRSDAVAVDVRDNAYGYALGNPERYEDYLGLCAAGAEACACCDGRGGFSICWNPHAQTLPSIFRSCIETHENNHLNYLTQDPGRCKNQCYDTAGRPRPKGWDSWQMAEAEHNDMECRGYAAEVRCLKQNIAQTTDKSLVLRRINQLINSARSRFHCDTGEW
jgi:RHS repeat-associated protein